MFVQQDFRIGGHHGFQFALGVINGNPDFKGGYIIFFHAHGRNLGDFAVESAVFVRLHLDARRLSQIDLGNIALIHFAFYIDFMNITHGHKQCGGRAQHQDGADRVAHFHVAGEHHAINRRNDGGVAIFLFGLVELRARLGNLCLGLLQLGCSH